MNQSKSETGVFHTGRNYYAVVRGFVYQLKAFATEAEAQDFASHLYSSPSFAREFGWIPENAIKSACSLARKRY